MIETKRLILRDYILSDTDRVHEYASNPTVCQFESWGPNNLQDTVNFIQDQINISQQKQRYLFDLAACLKTNSILIGGGAIRQESENSKCAHLGYVIHPSYQKQGYATEITNGLLIYGFNTLRMSIIYAICDIRNIASQRVLEKNNFTQAGILQKNMMNNSKIGNTFRYEITANQFSNNQIQ